MADLSGRWHWKRETKMDGLMPMTRNSGEGRSALIHDALGRYQKGRGR